MYNKNIIYIKKVGHMKKTLMILGVFVLLFASCSVLSPAEPTPSPSPAPTATPDPCSKENILGEVEDLQMLVSEFQEVEILANNTNFNFVYEPILRLQELRYGILRTKVPVCLEEFKAFSINYTASAIIYLTNFMQMNLNIEKVTDQDKENLDKAIQTSQAWWQEVTKEFNNIASNAGVEPQVTPESSNALPTPTGIAAIATNESTSTVNIREEPAINSAVVASLDKGEQAEIIGRNEAGDWLQVTMNDITGWVFTEMVVINTTIDQLPIVEVAP